MEEPATPQPEVSHSDRIAHTPRSASMRQFAGELLRNIAIVAAVVWIARGFVFQPYVVEGASMAPNLATSDYLIIDKLSYQFRQPERGEIVVFKYPLDIKTAFVKRVIGLPGETVKIESGKVTVINKNHPDGVVLDETYLPSGLLTNIPTGAAKSEYPVPADQYFVMGDNRPASADSRSWGYLPKSDLIGRATLRLFPLNKATVVTHAAYDGL